MDLHLQYYNSHFQLFGFWIRTCHSNTSESKAEARFHFLLRSFPTMAAAVTIPPIIIGRGLKVGMGHGSTNTVGLMLLTMVDTAELLTPTFAKLLVFSISVFLGKVICSFQLRFPE